MARTPKTTPSTLPDVQRPAAESTFADELQRLIAQDADLPKPMGWAMTPKSVVEFILGNPREKPRQSLLASGALSNAVSWPWRPTAVSCSSVSQARRRVG